MDYPPMTRRRVLVACHPMPFAGHWQESSIRAEMEALYPGDHIEYETMDLHQPFLKHQADIVGDLFNSSHKHLRHAFDVIILPDCGGEWYKMFQAYKETESVDLLNEDIIVIFNRLLGLLKDGGYLYMSKILMDEDTFVHAVNRLYGALLTVHKRYKDTYWGVNYVVMKQTAVDKWWNSD